MFTVCLVSVRKYQSQSPLILNSSFKVAPYSFTIVHALMTKAQVICACSKENISVFRLLRRQHEHKEQN